MQYPGYVKNIINSAMFLMVGLCTVASAPASAIGPWMMLTDGNSHESGVAPNRTLHYANASYIRELTDQNVKIAEIMKNSDPKTMESRLKALEVQEMDVIEIFENPKAPGFKQITMQFQCLQKRYRVVKTETVERNHIHRFSGATDWQRYTPGDWQSGAYFVACAQEMWQPWVQADIAEAKKTGVPSKQKSLQEYGMIVVGFWSSSEGVNKVYRLAWDRVWAGKATPTPFHHNRNVAEEAEYQAWKKGNDAVIAQNEKDAPAVLAGIAALEMSTTGELKSMDVEREFISAINKTFKTKSKRAQKFFYGMEGLTEEEIAKLWGAPKSVRDFGETRVFQYSKIIDTRATETTYVPNVVVGNGQGIDPGYSEVTTETGSLTECVMDLHLKPGGRKPGYRLVDFRGELCVWDTSGFD